MNYLEIAGSFLKKYNQHPDNININDVTNAMVDEMKKGLAGEKSSLMMIPTYLSTDGVVPLNQIAGAIDAGGTNIRVAAVSFTVNGLKVEKFHKQKMLGTTAPLTKQQFLDQLCELILPIVEVTDKIGFCFSFPAEIMPNKDGKVIAFCKEVNISGCEGMMLGEEINANLKKFGVTKDVKFVILNDTVSTLLGGPAVSEEEGVVGQIGLILGTGTNTAYTENISAITKIHDNSEGKMIINMEGEYELLGVQFKVELIDWSSDMPLKQPVGVLIADASKLELPFVVRSWKDGDWIRPLGMKGGKKKISDMFTDLKYTKLDKERALIVCLSDNQKSVALVGQRIDESIKVTSKTSSVIRISLI